MKLENRENRPGIVRSQDMIPGVVYGHGFESVSVQVPRKEFTKSYEKYRQTKTFNVEIGSDTHQVYIKELQRDVLTPEKIIHFDLIKVSGKDKIHTRIPLSIIGKDEITRRGLIVQQSVNDIDVKYQVGKGFENIEVDVSKLEDGDTIKLSDIEVPDFVEVMDDPDTLIVSVMHPKKEEEPEEEEVIIEPVEISKPEKEEK